MAMAGETQFLFGLAIICALQGAVGVPLHRTDSFVGTEHVAKAKESSPTFDRDLAEIFVNFSRICYCDDAAIRAWTCSTCQAMAPFEFEYQSNETFEHVGAYVGYWPRRNMVLVVFRGSEYLINFIQDLTSYAVDANYPQCDTSLENEESEVHLNGSTLQSPGSQPPSPLRSRSKCKVHSGFFDDWKDVRDAVLNATQRVRAAHPGAQTWVTGHSMGGAMAVFCAMDLRLRLQIPFVGLYTFGQPRVGNQPFAAFVAKTLPQALRIVHQDDVVPHLPPMTGSFLPLTNFHHNPTEVWQSGTRDDTFTICDQSGEDPQCSNSLPSWDRSVEAHMWYVRWPMHCELPHAS